MADSPDPNGPHEHLYEPHLLTRARAAAAADTPARAVICCVICSANTTLPSVPRAERDVVDDAHTLPSAPPPPVEGEAVEVVGRVEAAWQTWQVGTWRVVVGGHVVFASEQGGHLAALLAAWRAGEEVVVTSQRRRGDCYVTNMHRL